MRRLTLQQQVRIDAALSEAIDSFDGCGCSCQADSRDEDGNFIPGWMCLICKLKEARQLLGLIVPKKPSRPARGKKG